MTLPDALDTQLTGELAELSRSGRVEVLDPATGDGGHTRGDAAGATSAQQSGWRLHLPSVQDVKKRVRATAVNQLARVIRRIAESKVGRHTVDRFVTDRTAPIGAHVDDLAERLSMLSAQVAAVTADQGQSVADRINVALMKNDVTAISARVDEVLAEMRAQERRLLELGSAFAPGAGLAGAAVRFAELREQINSVERRLRNAPAAAAIGGSGESSPGSPAPGSPAPGSPAPSTSAEAGIGGVSPGVQPTSGVPSVASELFNYVAFERRFRGDPETIIAIQTERYSKLLAAHAPVVDIGCGRAELLEQLKEEGVEGIGVDTDSGMVAEARARGLDVRHTDALTFLEQTPVHSLGAVFSAHLVEHLELDVLIRFLELSAATLKPGGVFIAETPNPASLIVLGNSYILDPTHVRPLHPSLLAFLCETAGFRDVRLEFYSPASSYHLSQVRDADAPDWVRTVNANSERLNEVLFGPQEYAVIATTPS